MELNSPFQFWVDIKLHEAQFLGAAKSFGNKTRPIRVDKVFRGVSNPLDGIHEELQTVIIMFVLLNRALL